MKDHHCRDKYRVGMIRTAEYYEPFYEQLMSEDHVHLTVNHELQVPFIRGIRMAAESATINETLAQFGITMLLTENSTRIPLEIFSGELLRYLFVFDNRVVEKVDHIQQLLGILNKPYLAIHIRTGFLQDEQRHFNSRKALRNSTDWEKTINVLYNLLTTFSDQNPPPPPIYLATDSNLVKKLALSKYRGRQIKMVNLTLQHAALTTPKLPWQTNEGTHNAKPSTNFPEGPGNDNDVDVVNVSGVDGYMTTWVDFLLMARASALVHSISGFSVTAGQFCSTCSQYFVPYCTPKPSRRQY